ncbi:MAG: DNA primase [Planctomycetaceae bacterium]|nr:DNA primase [Planctomycetaceae bacterium]
MAGKWDYSIISRIQQANDITDVISEHMNLEKKGKELVGLCPFHTDHRPSLYVNPAKQIFKCFACGAGGDVLKFVQMKENLTFPQAVERLAQRAGIALEPSQSRSEKTGDELDPGKLAKLNQWVLGIWREHLWHAERGEAARAYLKKRSISEETAKKWQLGLAVDAWDDVVVKALAKKVPGRYLVGGGFAVEKERGRYYDKFRNRLMFPIEDVTGRVIGFGGRTLGDDPAKYMNSPATVLFDKSHSLYGLGRARQAISQTGTVVLVEGYTDVIMPHQFGVENVVAALGTSLTSSHARILRRYAKRIVLVFDSDVAGNAAANRALEICLSEKVDLQLAFVPEGKDPCEYVLEAGPEAFRKVTETAQDVLEFKWSVLERQLESGQSLSDRTEAIRQFLQTSAAAINARSVDSVSRTVLLSRLGELMKIPPSRIEQELAKIQKQQSRSERKDEGHPLSGLTVDTNDLVTRAQREVLESLLRDPGCFREVRGKLSAGEFGPDTHTKEIAEAMFGLLETGTEPSLACLYGRIESPQAACLLAELDAASGQKNNLRDQLIQAVKTLEEQRQNGRLEQAKQRLDKDEHLRPILKRIAQKGPNLRSAGI